MVQQIDAERTREMIQDEDVVLIDVLGPQSYNEHHLPGAVNVPVKHPEFEREMGEAIPSKDSKVVVYCASLTCQASPTAAKKLESMGYKNVYDFEAGLQGWEEAGHSFEGEGAGRIARRQTGGGDRMEQEARQDASRDEGGRQEQREEVRQREGQEEEQLQRQGTRSSSPKQRAQGDSEARQEKRKKGTPKTRDTGEKVEIDDIETHMQAR